MNIEGLRTVLSISNEMKAVKQGHIPRDRKTATYDTVEFSTNGYIRSKESMTKKSLDYFNFGFLTIKNNNMTVTRNSIIIDGTEYMDNQIPAVSLDDCIPIRAENNVIDIREGNYYQFNDINGKPHKMACTGGQLSNPYSEVIRGVHDEESWNLGHFWKILSKNGIYIGLDYTREQQKYYLEQAGVKKGFFTVKVGDKQQEYLYNTSNENWAVMIPKRQYDDDYKSITGQLGDVGLFNRYKPGAVFEIAGEKYTVSEKGTLDIPYGIDIYDRKYPPQSELKEKHR
ncbi:MAG: hypothetical protein IJ661_00525 [Lachnospiraceae bacterium]|nr:hypothetical protein [Lachnospiraceae bacterium]